MLRTEFFGQSDTGLKREFNEDAFIIREDLNICIAADGMGGAAAGELASRIFVNTAVRVFEKKAENSLDETIRLMKKAFNTANRDILDHVKTNPQHKGMGCTAEILAFTDNEFIIGHIGDSRTYRLRNRKLNRLTHDHSLVQEQIDKGLISEEEGKHHSMRNIVLRAIGVNDEIALDLVRGKILPGDEFLLCSDGLTDMVPEETIQKILTEYDNLSPKVSELIETANHEGGSDNITAVMARVNRDG